MKRILTAALFIITATVAQAKQKPDVLVSDGRPLAANNVVYFRDAAGAVVGTLKTDKGILSFEGNQNKSARIFLQYLKALYEAEYQAQVERFEAQEAAAKAEAAKKKKTPAKKESKAPVKK